MRQIKFRGKRLDNGKWVYGDLLTNNKEPKILTYKGQYSIDSTTIGQFTGLYGKHKTPIYEGDILDTPSMRGMLVVFTYGSFHMVTISGASHYFDAWINEIDKFEIIGNIHENKDLLEPKQDLQ